VEKPAPPPRVGTMVGNVDADIRPKVEGFLLSRLYAEGSFVRKGQPMFQLDKRQAEAAVDQATGNLERARAALAQAQIDVRRYTPLVAQRAVSQAEPEYRTGPDKINSFFVRNSKGQMTPLASLVSIRRVSGPEYTNRFNLFRSIQINGSPAPGYSSGQAMAAMEEVANEVLPAGYGYAWSDMSFQEKKASGGQAMVFGMSFLFVFLILAALYESWSLPFSVLLSVPVAVLGAYGGLLLRKFDNNVFSQIGLVMLIGLTAKNAILIVEFAILEHAKGKDLVEAALEGARLRLRPILMTSFAFILGCVPLWTAKGAGAIGRKVLGSSVVMGMSAASILGIFLVPVLFVVVERLAGKKKKQTVTVPGTAALEGGHD
jgi:hydrophobic/amphiphilic exporter-1 (mainly G- bacteria), HAE1 family